MKLRPYQIEAIRKVYGLMVDGKRAIILQSPTGSGKTAMASQVIRDAAIRRGRNVLVLAHRGELVDQLSGSLAIWDIPHGIIRAGKETESGRPVQVASIQSLDGSVALPHLGADDLIVVDEAHRADGDKVFLRYPHVKRLGLTATPYRMVGSQVRPLIPEYTDLVVAATPRGLEAAHFIVPITILAPPLPDPKMEDDLFDEEHLTKRERVMGNAQVMGDVVTHWVTHGPRPTIGYCCGISHSKKQAELFKAAGIKAVHISGQEPLEKRRDILQAFRDRKFDILLNSDLLIEGLDVPFVSRILMLRPTQSPAVYLQQAGRGVRISDGKQDCQLFDHAGNFFVHGHPYDERLTSMQAIPGIGRPVADHTLDGIWRCPKCFCCVVGSVGKSCPYCAAPVVFASRKIKVVAGHLVEYDEEALRIAKENKDRDAEKRAMNDQRIRSLFGIAMRNGKKGADARAYVFTQLAVFNKSGVTWEKFYEEAQQRTRKPLSASSTAFNPHSEPESS